MNRFSQIRTARIHLFILPSASLRDCTISFDIRSTSVKASWQMEHGDAHTIIGGRGMQQPKIAISTIQDVLRAVEEAPDCDETEVAKVEAMRRLVPALKAMQAKGYGVAHITKLLCDKGIAVTEASLRQYMHRLGSRKAAESSRVGRRDRLAIGSPAKPLGHSARSSDVTATTQARSQSSRTDVAVTAPARSQPSDTDAAVTTPPRSGSGTASVSLASPPPAPTSPATQMATSRSGFVVRPDREKI